MVRQRHPFGAATRETHASSPFDVSDPSDRLYGSEMDIEPVTSVDLGAGSVTDGSIVDGGLDGATAIRPGTLPPSSGDQTPPALPTMVTVESELVTDSNGNSAPAIKVSMLPPTDEDYSLTYVEATDINDGDPVAPVPVWVRPIIVVAGKESTVVFVTGVAGLTQYWVRMRTVDTSGNSSAYSAIYPVMTVGDTVPPPVPQNVTGVSGFKLIGVRWAAGSSADLMFNEVRVAPDLNPLVGTGGPDVGAWLTRRTTGNYIIVDSLTPGVFYWAQVRAVDYSRNTVARWAVTGDATTNVLTCAAHAFADGDRVSVEDMAGAPELAAAEELYVRDSTGTTFKLAAAVGGAAIDFSTAMTGFVGPQPATGGDVAVDYLAEPDAGWSQVAGPTEAAMIGAADLALNSLITNMISTGYIDAATIDVGVLEISTVAGTADGLRVLYGGGGGYEIGRWDESGLYIRSKAVDRSALDYIHLDDAALKVYLGGVAQSAITTEGINATAINFGTSPGGHNLIFNSSFEMSPFSLQTTEIIGSGGSTLAGGSGGWTMVGVINATVTPTSVTMTAV